MAKTLVASDSAGKYRDYLEQYLMNVKDQTKDYGLNIKLKPIRNAKGKAQHAKVVINDPDKLRIIREHARERFSKEQGVINPADVITHAMDYERKKKALTRAAIGLGAGGLGALAIGARNMHIARKAAEQRAKILKALGLAGMGTVAAAPLVYGHLSADE